MKLYAFIKDIEYFLQDRIGSVTFLNKLDDTEEELLDLEEKKDTSSSDRIIIVKALDILDNIRMMIDSPGFKKDKLGEELRKIYAVIKENSKVFLKPSGQFMVSRPAFEAHPGMKEKLPSRPSEPKELPDFIKDIKKFLLGEIDKDIILDKLDTVEEYLLEKEEVFKTTNPRFRDVIVSAMEILDNIRIILDESDEPDEEELKVETGKWIKIEYFLKSETVPPVHKNVTPVSPYKSDSKISAQKEAVKSDAQNRGLSQFMVSRPGFEAHPGMKEKLPSGQSPHVKEIEGLGKDIKRFFTGHADKDTIFDKLETVEEHLLDMEEFAKNSDFRSVILEAMEVLDNIRVIIDDYPSIDEDELQFEMDKWTKLEVALKKEYTPHTVPERINHGSKIEKDDIHSDILKKATSSDISSTDKLLKKVESQLQPEINERFILSKPEFEAHPGMKDRLPVEKHELLSSDEEKASPLYGFLEAVKKYISGYGSLKDVTVMLQNTCLEFTRLVQEIGQDLDTEDYSNDSLSGFTSMIETIEDIDERELLMSPEERKNKENFLRVLEEILDILSSAGRTGKYNIEEFRLLAEDLRELNIKLVSLQKYVFLVPQEIDEEEELVKNILNLITEDDILTTNYVDIKDGALNFLRGDIDEDEFIRILDEMKEIIDEAKEEYDEEYTYTDGWALESSTGDKILRQGIREWEEALDMFYDSYVIKDERKIHMAIKKAYEANKKLIINQKLEDFINDQVRARTGYSMDYF